jgi:hypothetical protein
MEQIKTDCIMYVEEVNKCNGLITDTCKNCSFYKTDKKEEYVREMKKNGTYILNSKKNK